MFSNEDLRRAMYFVQPNWPGGMYASPTMSGSRPGGLIACCWASLIAIGEDGYKSRAKQIYDAAVKIRNGIPQISGLYVVGESRSSVVAFGAKNSSLNVYKVTDAMKSRGWNLNNLQNPVAVHVCVTLPISNKAEEFLKDLRDSVAQVTQNPDSFPHGTAAMYGMAASFPDRSTVAELGSTFLDAVLQA